MVASIKARPSFVEFALYFNLFTRDGRNESIKVLNTGAFGPLLRRIIILSVRDRTCVMSRGIGLAIILRDALAHAHVLMRRAWNHSMG